LLGAGIASASTGANQPGPTGDKPTIQAQHFNKKPFKKGPNDLTKEQREALKTAMESCDYDAWKAVMGNRPITQKINEGNFARFCEAHHLLRDGKVDEARAIFKELGLKMPHPHHKRSPKPGQQPAPQPPAPQPQQ
jgi:hypothetical protein